MATRFFYGAEYWAGEKRGAENNIHLRKSLLEMTKMPVRFSRLTESLMAYTKTWYPNLSGICKRWTRLRRWRSKDTWEWMPEWTEEWPSAPQACNWFPKVWYRPLQTHSVEAITMEICSASTHIEVEWGFLSTFPSKFRHIQGVLHLLHNRGWWLGGKPFYHFKSQRGRVGGCQIVTYNIDMERGLRTLLWF